MKPEQDLICSALHLLGVRPPRTVPHPFDPAAPSWQGGQVVPLSAKPWNQYATEQLKSAARRGGSFNHIALRLLCGVAAGEAGADAAAIAWLVEERDVLGLDGMEVGCRNDYWLMSRGADYVFVRRGSPALRDLAFGRLDSYRFWASSGAPITGQRSAVGGLEQFVLIDEWADFTGGRSAAPPSTHPPTWDRMLLGELMPEVLAAMHRPLANPKTAIATRTTLYVGGEAVAVVQDAEVDTNTDGVLVCREEKDRSRKRTWAPTPPWGRIRQQGSGGRVATIRTEQTGSPGQRATFFTAHYTSRLLGNVDVPLPAKNLKIFRLGSGSTEPEGQAPAQPPAATPGTVERGPAPALGAPPTAAHHRGCVTSLIELGTLAAAAWSLVAVFGS